MNIRIKWQYFVEKIQINKVVLKLVLIPISNANSVCFSLLRTFTTLLSCQFSVEKFFLVSVGQVPGHVGLPSFFGKQFLATILNDYLLSIITILLHRSTGINILIKC